MKFNILIIGAALLGLTSADRIIIIETDSAHVQGIVNDLTSNGENST
jgi:hypothetical protein